MCGWMNFVPDSKAICSLYQVIKLELGCGFIFNKHSRLINALMHFCVHAQFGEIAL